MANNRVYYFYLSARDAQGNVAQWTELKITPKLTRRVFKNNPDPPKFEIEMTENESSYLLEWPDKNENSRRYLIKFYVNGKRQSFKIISGEIYEYEILKDPSYIGADLRFTVRSLPKDQFGARYSDGIYWKPE